jgi:multidrug efflux system membrane fusion protein
MRRYWLALFGMVLISGIVSFLGFQSPSKTPEASAASAKPNTTRPITVSVAPIVQKDFTIWLNALGTVIPRTQAQIKSRIDGALLKLHFTEGQTVEKGQLLAEIDPRPLQSQLAQAIAQQNKNKALLLNAKQDLKRYQQLRSEDAIATQQLDTQVALVKQYEASIASDQAQIDALNLQLSYTNITAPFRGVLGFRQVDVGNHIQAASTTLVSLIEQDPITVVFSLPDQQLTSIQQHRSSLNIEIWDKAQQHRLATSQNWLLDNQIDATTASIRLKAIVSNPQQQLYPNQFVHVRIALETLKQALVIPQAALQHNKQSYFVYQVLPDQHIAAVPVKLLAQADEWAAVSGDLTPGMNLITAGTDKLKADSLVRISDSQANSKPQTKPQ